MNDKLKKLLMTAIKAQAKGDSALVERTLAEFVTGKTAVILELDLPQRPQGDDLPGGDLPSDLPPTDGGDDLPPSEDDLPPEDGLGDDELGDEDDLGDIPPLSPDEIEQLRDLISQFSDVDDAGEPALDDTNPEDQVVGEAVSALKDADLGKLTLEQVVDARLILAVGAGRAAK